MPYYKSSHRKTFEARVIELDRQAKLANRLPRRQHAIRDMAFQCAIFLTSAALETYVKLLIESWIFSLCDKDFGDKIPDSTRGFIAVHYFRRHFEKFSYSRDEGEVTREVLREHTQWPFFNKPMPLPRYFDGKILSNEVSYPSQRNLKKLFGRVGISDFEDRLSRTLKRDVDLLISGFQDVRTAIAHSSPPELTLRDVRDLLSDMLQLVRAIDRIFYQHVSKHGGVECWS